MAPIQSNTKKLSYFKCKRLPFCAILCSYRPNHWSEENLYQLLLAFFPAGTSTRYYSSISTLDNTPSLASLSASSIQPNNAKAPTRYLTTDSTSNSLSTNTLSSPTQAQSPNAAAARLKTCRPACTSTLASRITGPWRGASRALNRRHLCILSLGAEIAKRERRSRLRGLCSWSRIALRRCGGRELRSGLCVVRDLSLECVGVWSYGCKWGEGEVIKQARASLLIKTNGAFLPKSKSNGMSSSSPLKYTTLPLLSVEWIQSQQ